MTEEEGNRPSPEFKGGTPERTPKIDTPLENLEAQAGVSLEQQAQIHQAEQSAENADRQGQIELFLMENELFGFEPYSPEVLADLSQLLEEKEATSRQSVAEFDITADWSEKQILRYFERKYTNQKLDTEEAEDKTADNQYAKAERLIREKHQPNSVDNLTLAKELRDNHAKEIPPEYLSRLQAFVQMQEMATTPEDKEIVTAKINSLDFSTGIPNPVLFVETAILADDSFSESYRDTVAKRFNLPNPRVKTGGQVNQTLDARDPDGKPLYTSANPVEIGHHTQAYVKPDGSRVVRVDTGDGRAREIPWDRNTESDDVIGTKISLAKIWAVNEWDGQTDFFGESIDIENDILSQTDPQKLTKVRNTMNAIFGGTRGFDAVIIQDNEAAFVGWFNQFLFPKGDAAIGDFDKGKAVDNRENLGLHPNGNFDEIDYEVLRAAALFAKDQYGSGTPNYFTLQKHLHKMFPEKNIPLTGENAPEREN